VTEPEALRSRRLKLLDQTGKVADEISKIDERLTILLQGNRGQGGATV
jgi:hypothetical protein